MIKYVLVFLFAITLQIGNSQTLITPLSSDFTPNGEVLILDIKSQFEGKYFLVGIIKDNKVIAQTEQYVRSGTHSYELRHLKEYEGKIDFIATSLPKEAFNSSALKRPNLLHEIDIIMSKSIFSPRTVNFVRMKTFKGRNFIFTVIGFTILVFLLTKFIGKQTLILAYFTSLVIGTIFYDLTCSMVTHHNIYQNIEQKYPYLDAVKETQKFIEQVRPHIGQGRWTFRGKIQDEYQKLFMRYSLADIDFVPESIKKLPRDTYIITTESPTQNQQIVIKNHQFLLLKQD